MGNPLFIFFDFLLLHGAYLAGKAEQIDKAFCVMMVVQVTCGKGSDGFVIQGIRGGGACLDDISLVKFEFHFAGYIFLSAFYESLDSLAQRGKPFSFIHDLCEFIAHIKLRSGGFTIQDQLFQLLMSFIKDGSAGSLVNAAGFHAYHTVFHDIHDADAVLAAQLVQLADDIGNLHFFTVDAGGGSFFKGHGYIFGFIGRFFRSGSQYEQMLIVRLIGRILQLQSFMADVPQVTVTAVAAVCREGKVNAVRLAVFDFGFTGIPGPLLISPGCDDL